MQRLRDGHCILILFLVIVVLFRKAIFSTGVILSHPIFIDLTHQIYAWRLYGFGLLKKGIIPLWNPYVFCGCPFVAHWEAATFYPLYVIFLFIPIHIAINYLIAFHILLSGVFTYAFVRYLLKDRFSALIAALTFMLSGPLIVQRFPGHPFPPIAWFPLSLLLAELAVRRGRMFYFLLGGLVLALQILGGHPQYMAYCTGALLIYFVYRTLCSCRDRKSLAPIRTLCIGLVIFLVVGISLSAVQIIPGLEFKDHSSRALLRGPESVSEVSLPPENLLTLIVPGFFGDMMGVRYWGRWLLWETCLYVGVIALLLAVIGALLVRNRYTLFFAGLAILTTILAFGAYSPLFPLLYRFVPGFNIFRGQAKFICLTAFSLAVLAGYGTYFITRLHADRKKSLRLLGLAALAMAAIVLLVCIIVSTTGGEQSFIWKQVLRYRAARGFEGTPPPDAADRQLIISTYRVALQGTLISALFMVASGMIVLLVAKGKLLPTVLKCLILIAVIADLWYFGSKYIIVSPLSACYWPREIVDYLKADRSAFRVLAPNIAVPGADQNMNEEIHTIGGYQSTNVGLFTEYVDFSQGVLPSEAKLSFSINNVTPMLEALGLKHLILPEGTPFARAGYIKRFSASGATVYERTSPVPRVYICRRAKVVKGKIAALEEVRRISSVPTEYVILEEEVEGGFTGPAQAGAPRDRARIVQELPNELVIDAQLKSPGFLVLSDVYYPGWKAYADGKELPIYRANYAFRAVYLDKGRHRVRFIYKPSSFIYGAVLSLSTVLALIVLFLVMAGKRIICAR